MLAFVKACVTTISSGRNRIVEKVLLIAMNMNGKKLSNSKVLWLVSSLFVVTASQCGLKKEANNRGPANSADRSSEGRNETSGENVVEEIPHKDKMPENSDSDRHSESQKDSALAGFNVYSESHTPGGLNTDFGVGQISDVARRLGERIKAIKHSDFMSSVGDHHNPPSSQTHLFYDVWDRYYKPCSMVWIYLEYLNLSSVAEVQQRLNGCTQSQNQEKETLSLLLDLVRFLTVEDLAETTYYQESFEKPGINITNIYDVSFKAFINGRSNFRQGIDGLVRYLTCQYVTDSEHECKVKPKEFVVYFNKFVSFFDKVSDTNWYWTKKSAVGDIALGLTEFEFHLEKLFGKKFSGYTRAVSDESSSANVLNTLINFYKRELESIAYNDIINMDFNKLGDEVKNALQKNE